MHTEALNFILFVKNSLNHYFINKKVLDVGSGDINGNNASLFTNCEYQGNDVIPGNNVTIVSKTKDLLIKDESIDTIISTECFHLDPEYPDSFRKIYKMLKENGLFFFTCAAVGRWEHGTKRTTPINSFGTIGNLPDMVNYYKNLTEKNINDVLNLNDSFSSWNLYHNEKTKDLYFIGIKKSKSASNVSTKLVEFTDTFVTNTSNNIYQSCISSKNNYMPNVGLLISTCKHYFSNIPKLLVQINQSWFPNKNVIIVSGQEDNLCNYYIDDVEIINVDYTGLHLTSFIYVNENIAKYPNIHYWIALPDTIKFGNNFFDSILEIYHSKQLYNNNSLQVIPFINEGDRPSMDMGIVHSKHMIHMTEYLQKIKTYEKDFDRLRLLKKQLIYDENTILGYPSGFEELCTKHNCSILGSGQIEHISQNTGNVEEQFIENGRINQVYFKLLDLYKYQRNFISPDVDLILTL